MKRIAAKTIALILAAAVSAAVPTVSAYAENSIDYNSTLVYGQASEKCTLKSFKSNLTYVGSDYKVPVLNKSRTLKKQFCLSESETLIIPKGKTLKLTGGANIKGTIYIENGGSLVLEKYTVQLEGSIFCDGRISITGGTLSCGESALLFISEAGNFNVTDTGYDEEYGEYNGRISVDTDADTVCLGKTNYPAPTFFQKPVAAVRTIVEFGGGKVKTELYSGDLNELMPGTVGCAKFDPWSGDFFDSYTVLFDGGSCVKFTGFKEHGWESIGGVNISWLTKILDIYRNPDHIKDLETY